MKRVLILTHGFLHDRRNGTTFHECIVANPDPAASPKSKVRLGVAEDVDPAIVREYFLGHRNYQVSGYTDEELYPDGVPEEILAAREAAEEVDPPDPTEDQPGGMESSEGGPGAGEEDAGKGTPNPLAGVDFDNDNAMELAAELGLTKADMKKVAASGKSGGYLTKDVRLANKKSQV